MPGKAMEGRTLGSTMPHSEKVVGTVVDQSEPGKPKDPSYAPFHEIRRISDELPQRCSEFLSQCLWETRKCILQQRGETFHPHTHRKK